MQEQPGCVKLSVAIREWTQQDYLTGEAPYKWLYEQRDNAFEFEQAREIIARKASELGVRNFKKIFNEYAKLQLRSGGHRIEAVTEFDGQERELLSGRYRCNDYGVTFFNDYGVETVVCAHPIMPVRRLVNIDTGEVKMEIAFKRGSAWRRVIFDKQVLSSAQKIVALASYGIGVDSENAKHMVVYLSAIENLNYDALPEANSVGRLGWVSGHGFSPYVENLIFDGNEGYKHTFDSVRAAGSYEKWFELALSVRAGNSIAARIALAASFASVLVNPLDALPFMVHLWGGAGSGKTVGLMLAASVWANPAVGDYVKTFNGTTVSNELNAGFCGSLPLLLDELQVIKNQKDFDQIIYMLCEGAGKGRGAKGGGLQKIQTWRNCTISTGEMPITTGQSGAGAVNRVIEIDCKDEKLFSDPRGAVATMLKNYGHAGRRFIDALKNDGIMDGIHGMQQAFYEQLCDNATEKQALAASIILTADALTELILFKDDHALTLGDIIPFLSTRDAADVNRRAYEWLTDFVAANPSKFTPNNFGEYTGECWGVVEENSHGGGVAYIIRSVFDRIMNDSGYSASSFLSWAKRQNKIESKASERRCVKQKRIRGLKIAPWCVALILPNDDESVAIADEETKSEVQQAFYGI